MISKGRPNIPTDAVRNLADDRPKWELNPNYRDGDWWLNNLRSTNYSAWLSWWRMYEKGLDIKPDYSFI